jgi:hypothetical protein
LQHLAKEFPANIPWPMTLAPANEAINVKSSERKPEEEKKICRSELGCPLDAWIIIIISKREVGESRRMSLY